MREYIITMTAENRVGILAAVTNAMSELGADLLETSQTVVRGYFTMIFAAQFPDDREQSVILDHLRDVCRPFGIEVSMTPQAVDLSTSDTSRRTVKRLKLFGRNVPGVLRRIGVKMSINQIDIVGMHAWKEGEDRFEMVMRIAIPDSYRPEDLAEELRSIDDAWELEVELDDYHPASSFTNET